MPDFRPYRTPSRLLKKWKISWFLAAFLFFLLLLIFTLNLSRMAALIQEDPSKLLREPQEADVSSPAKNTYVSKEKCNNVAQMSTKEAAAFVHIGKTAGSSLSVLLRNGCHSFVPKPCRHIPPSEESIVSKLVEKYYHGKNLD